MIAFPSKSLPSAAMTTTRAQKCGMYLYTAPLWVPAFLGERHLHFELRTTSAAAAGRGLLNRLDPGEILGYELYGSGRVQIGGYDLKQQMCAVAGKATPRSHVSVSKRSVAASGSVN